MSINQQISLGIRPLELYVLILSQRTIVHTDAFVQLFENKIDHTTYFGANQEYTQGIHMLPLSPASGFTRLYTFMQEEWNTYFNTTSADPATNITGGWKGILYGNLACIDPKASWKFFSQPHFDGSWIDGGASRTWYLAFAAGELS